MYRGQDQRRRSLYARFIMKNRRKDSKSKETTGNDNPRFQSKEENDNIINDSRPRKN